MHTESFVSTAASDLTESTNLVIEALGKHHSRDTIIRALCRRHGVDWSAAETFLLQIESEYQHRIARRQAPLILFFAITGMIGGVLLLIYYGFLLLGLISHPHIVNPARVLRWVGLFGSGIALVIISSISLWKPITSFFRR